MSAHACLQELRCPAVQARTDVGGFVGGDPGGQVQLLIPCRCCICAGRLCGSLVL